MERTSRRDFIKKIAFAGAAFAVSSSVIYKLFEYLGSRQATEISEFADLYAASGVISKGTATLSLYPAVYYFTMTGGTKCTLCPRECLVLPEQTGLCRVRVNRGGKLYTLVYGNPCSANNDPIEKKPVFHFLPGSTAFSISTAGCNERCKYCQNWQISQFGPEDTKNYPLSPEDVVAYAISTGSKSIAYTYGEPVVFYEYMLQTAKLARKSGVKNVVITGGYINEDPLKELCRHVDVIKIDLKGFDEGFYRDVCAAELSSIQNSLKVVKESGTWLEIVNLVVPTLNDSQEKITQMCKWIKSELGADIPLHFSRFSPNYKLLNLPPTPISTLEMARKVALGEGLKYVYIGNIPHSESENTYCPKCGKLLIERLTYFVAQNNIENGRCKFCGQEIPGVWT
jgi:pyruvate formate lyase activating enzyme